MMKVRCFVIAKDENSLQEEILNSDTPFPWYVSKEEAKEDMEDGEKIYEVVIEAREAK